MSAALKKEVISDTRASNGRTHLTDTGRKGIEGMKKRRIQFKWTCSDYMHHEHKWKWQAYICGLWQRAFVWLWWQAGGAVAPSGIAPVSVRCSEWVDAQPLTAQKYYELLYQVGRKYPGETRHETALRYIKHAEENNESAQASNTKLSHPAESERGKLKG